MEKTHSKEIIAQAIRRSLKGEAGRIVMRLGPYATVEQILGKLSCIYGDVEEKEAILGEFYGARQKQNENVTEWSCRLEDILSKATMNGEVPASNSDKMLHDMLWKGLRSELKDITHYEKERYSSFDQLRVALRRIEKENHPDVDKKISKQISKKAVTEEKTEADDEIKGMLKQITHRLDNLESAQRGRSRYKNDSRGSRRRSQSPKRRDYRHYNNNTQGRTDETPSNYADIICNRCGREGHISRGCRANTHVDGKRLNWSKSAKRGRS